MPAPRGGAVVTRFRRFIAQRRWVHGVLGVWVLAWALVLLQPCCEAVAGSLPHQHVAVAAAEHHHHDPAAESDTGLALDHDHCQHIDARDLNQPIDIAASGLKAPQPGVIVLHAIAPTFPPPRAVASEPPLLAVARASPIPLYLRTLRLRD